MIVTAAELANDSKRILDAVVQKGESVQIQRHGKTVAVIKPQVGVSGKEFARRLNQIKFSKAEREELKKAMDEGGEYLGYVGGN
jgi:antitoxin (DNA-binding transcriptional repressor) of toxin-antitoxin stability system